MQYFADGSVFEDLSVAELYCRNESIGNRVVQRRRFAIRGFWEQSLPPPFVVRLCQSGG